MTENEENLILKKICCTNDLDTLLLYLTEVIEESGFSYYRIDLIDSKKENLIIKKIKFSEEHENTTKSVIGGKIPLNSQEEIMVLCYHKDDMIEINPDNLKKFGNTTLNRFNYFKIKYAYCIPLSKNNLKIGSLAIFSLNLPFDTNNMTLLKEKISLFIEPLNNFLAYQFLITEGKENKNLLEKIGKVFEVAETINSLTSIERIYEVIISELLKLFHFHCGIIYLKKGNLLKVEYFHLIDESYRFRMNKYLDLLDDHAGYNLESKESTFAIWAYINNTSNFFHDISGHISSEKYTKQIEVMNVKTYFCLPIRIKNRPIGALSLFTMDSTLPEKEIDIKTIDALCNLLGTSIRNSEIYSELEEKNRIISEDLGLAKRIQQNVIFSEHTKIKELDFYFKYKPQSEIGGDIYDISIIKEKYIRIFLSDATGHGIQAALTTMIISNEYQKLKMLYQTPDSLMTALNNSFLERYYNLTVFFTCIVLDIDLENKRIVFSSAGHPDQYLICFNGIKRIKTIGNMIGVFKNAEYVSSTIDISINDKILLFTDGLYEVFNTKGQEFGETCLYSLVNNAKQADIHNLSEYLVEEISRFAEKKNFEDDLTIIGIEFNKGILSKA